MTRASSSPGAKARRYRPETFRRVGSFPWKGEGQELCHDGVRLCMSDGGDAPTVRDPPTFKVIGRVSVASESSPVSC